MSTALIRGRGLKVFGNLLLLVIDKLVISLYLYLFKVTTIQ